MLLWGTLLLTGVGMLLQGGEAQETNCPETILCDKAGQADQCIQNRFLKNLVLRLFTLVFAFHEILLVIREFFDFYEIYCIFSET
jgi:hypothetical protein